MENPIHHYAREKSWAVVGASNDPQKFGNRIYRRLKGAGYDVYPVHPREKTIDGDPAFSSVLTLPKVPTVVNLVVPPAATRQVVQDAAQAGAQAVWFQPGSEDAQAIAWARENGLEVIQDCILVRHVQNP